MEFMENKTDNTLCFTLNDQPEEILKLEKGFFWYRGRKIKDINNVYGRFCKFISFVEDKRLCSTIEGGKI